MDDIAQIIEGCKKNKRSAQDRLYYKYNSLLFGICLRYAKSKPEAEDILQEVFVKIYKHIGTYTPGKSFEGWIKRIAVNTSITNYRKEKKRAYHQDITEVPQGQLDHDIPSQNEFTQEELMISINRLAPGYKMVFNMYVIEGYKHKEIAEKLGVDINTSKSQLSRAKKQLQGFLLEMSEINLPKTDY